MDGMNTWLLWEGHWLKRFWTTYCIECSCEVIRLLSRHYHQIAPTSISTSCTRGRTTMKKICCGCLMSWKHNNSHIRKHWFSHIAYIKWPTSTLVFKKKQFLQNQTHRSLIDEDWWNKYMGKILVKFINTKWLLNRPLYFEIFSNLAISIHARIVENNS
jgi:hypothetical protein